MPIVIFLPSFFTVKPKNKHGGQVLISWVHGRIGIDQVAKDPTLNWSQFWCVRFVNFEVSGFSHQPAEPSSSKPMRVVLRENMWDQAMVQSVTVRLESGPPEKMLLRLRRRFSAMFKTLVSTTQVPTRHHQVLKSTMFSRKAFPLGYDIDATSPSRTLRPSWLHLTTRARWLIWSSSLSWSYFWSLLLSKCIWHFSFFVMSRVHDRLASIIGWHPWQINH